MTTYDFILHQWPAQAQRIIAAVYANDKRSAEYTLTSDVQDIVGWPNHVLASLFIWEQTPEGHEYWKQIAEQEGDKA